MVERTITTTVAADPECGVAIWAPRRLRDMKGFQKAGQLLDDHVDPVSKAAAIALDRLASDIARDVADERARGVRRLILSEENLMGGMRNNFRTGVFYPDVTRRLAAFDSLLPTSPTIIALGVRDYGAVWTSAYHYLPQSGQAAPPLDEIRPVLLEDRRGWMEIVNDIKVVWPDARIVMWRQEDLNDNLRDICATLAALDPARIVVPEGKINARKDSTPRPVVFTDAELKHLSTRYVRHLRRLRADDAIEWAA